MRVHLRLSEMDPDLCRWRHSVKKRMITYYIRQILLSEMRGEIAYIPTSWNVSATAKPCEVYMNFKDDEIETFLAAIPSYKRNGTIKRIIRKHLQAQVYRPDKAVVYQEEQSKQPRGVSANRKTEKVPLNEPEQIPEKPIKEYVESEEDRAAILALIAMSGE